MSDLHPSYLDHAATTPMRGSAIEAVRVHLGDVGNPSSTHAAGRRARRCLEESRETIAAAFGADPAEVLFTSGGTEGDNLALKGIYWARRAADDRRRRVLIGAAEHHAVGDAGDWLARTQGAETVGLPVGGTGVVSSETLRAAIAADPDSVAVISVVWGNNETGSVSPIADLARVAHEYGVPLHTDAVQAAGHVEVSLRDSGADAITLSAHKLGGPVGIGALLLTRATAPHPVLHGGGQEREIRSGTLDVAGAAGFAAAAADAVGSQPAESVRLAGLRDSLLAALPGIPTVPAGTELLPHIAHLCFPGCESETLLMLLDGAGVQCSAGSACSSGVQRVSPVLDAIGCDPAHARGALRFSLGHTSTAADADAAIAAVMGAVPRARAAAAATSAGYAERVPA